MTTLENDLTSVDLFSVCGGITQGFKNCGFKSVLAIEKNQQAADTFKNNRP